MFWSTVQYNASRWEGKQIHDREIVQDWLLNYGSGEITMVIGPSALQRTSGTEAWNDILRTQQIDPVWIWNVTEWTESILCTYLTSLK